jgi:hypothetical protein
MKLQKKNQIKMPYFPKVPSPRVRPNSYFPIFLRRGFLVEVVVEVVEVDAVEVEDDVERAELDETEVEAEVAIFDQTQKGLRERRKREKNKKENGNE